MREGGEPRSNWRTLKAYKGRGLPKYEVVVQILTDSLPYEREEGTVHRWQSEAGIQGMAQILQCRAIMMDSGRGRHCKNTGNL